MEESATSIENSLETVWFREANASYLTSSSLAYRIPAKVLEMIDVSHTTSGKAKEAIAQKPPCWLERPEFGPLIMHQ
jgi:hypothetical protein